MRPGTEALKQSQTMMATPQPYFIDSYVIPECFLQLHNIL